MTRKITFTLLALVASLNLHAQQTALLSKDVINGLLFSDSASVVERYTQWDRYVAQHPQDENGWRNLYWVSKRYTDFLTGEDYNHAMKKETSVLGRMEKAIPDSYTFNICAHDGSYRMYQSDAAVTDQTDYAARAIELMPDDVPGSDYETLATYLVSQQDTMRLTDMLRRFYDSGQFPQEQLQYDYNELQGMDEGGVYIAQHQGNILGKLILQRVIGVHQDKILYCENFATYPGYLSSVFRQIGLSEDFLASGSAYRKEWQQEKQLEMVIRYIFTQSKRPVYVAGNGFSTLVLGKGLPDDLKENLYNEGLTLRYSAVPYDNRKVKQRNVEERYLLDYLRFPFAVNRPNDYRNYAQPADQLAFNYAILFYDLLPYYAARHDLERYFRLNALLNSILDAKLGQTTQQVFNVGSSMFMVRKLEDGGTHFQVVAMRLHTKKKDDGTTLIYSSEEDQTTLFTTDPDKQ